MTNLCTKRLMDMETNGTQQDILSARRLLNENISFSNITELAKILSIGNSSMSRFVKRLGYPSFKHFYYEYISKNEGEEKYNYSEGRSQLSESTADREQVMFNKIVEEMASKIRGRIFIISSRRGKSIAKFMSERLNDGKVENVLFHESTDDIHEFFKKITKNDTVFVITLSGHSMIISRAITEIALINESEKPQVAILTASQYMSIFKKYEYISLGIITNKKYSLDDWKNYNFAILKMMNIIILLLNKLYDDKLLKNKR